MDKKLNCEEVLDNLGEFLDESSRAEICREIQEHMRHCHGCQVQVDSVKKTIVLYQADRVSEIPLTVSSKLRAALAQAYKHPSV